MNNAFLRVIVTPPTGALVETMPDDAYSLINAVVADATRHPLLLAVDVKPLASIISPAFTTVVNEPVKPHELVAVIDVDAVATAAGAIHVNPNVAVESENTFIVNDTASVVGALETVKPVTVVVITTLNTLPLLRSIVSAPVELGDIVR